jgi:hypothetical protein
LIFSLLSAAAAFLVTFGAVAKSDKKGFGAEPRMQADDAQQFSQIIGADEKIVRIRRVIGYIIDIKDHRNKACDHKISM